MASFLSALDDVTVTCNVSVASRSCAQARGEKILHCKVGKISQSQLVIKLKQFVFLIYRMTYDSSSLSFAVCRLL